MRQVLQKLVSYGDEGSVGSWLQRLDSEDRTIVLDDKKLFKKCPHPVRNLLLYYKECSGFYPLTSSPQVIVVNIKKGRKNSELDKVSLDKMLQKFALEPKLIEDGTVQELTETTRELAKSPLISALIIFVMAHGSAGHFDMIDGKVCIQDFLNNVMYCTETCHIPKVNYNEFVVIRDLKNTAYHYLECTMYFLRC